MAGSVPYNIAILYYTQTGQLKMLAEKVSEGFSGDCRVDFIEIIPVKQFPFPWNTIEFFDAMPECVLEEGSEIRLSGYEEGKHYDLVILAYQPWFLHPSLPITGFLQSKWADKLLKDVKVITLTGARNMWLNALEKIKRDLHKFGSEHVGNIAFVDSSPNLISTLTVIRWAFKGRKEASGLLPEAGVQVAEINRGPLFGKLIASALQEGKWQTLQQELVKAGAVTLKPGLILLEETAIGQFKMWARKIKAKGERGSPARRPLVRLFKNILIVGIFILSPIKFVVSKIQAMLNRKRLVAAAKYFQSVNYEENKFS
ncbi:MAG TPA: hypothetical protein PL069_02125 [Saprospiraceae bacterium]|nr:hypothetical protein [Saprospiraceae bacterium]